MDVTYLFLNTILYGMLALIFSIFFSSGKIMNFALGNYLVVCSYILYSFFHYGFHRMTFGVSVGFIGGYMLFHRLLLTYFPHDKQRDLVGLVMSIGLAVVLENVMNYLY